MSEIEPTHQERQTEALERIEFGVQCLVAIAGLCLIILVFMLLEGIF